MSEYKRKKLGKRLFSAILSVAIVASSFSTSFGEIVYAEDTTSLLTDGLIADYSAEPPAAPKSWYFDLGIAGSAVAEGYIAIDDTTVYTPELGYGPLVGVGGRDQDGNALSRDFLMLANTSFVVDVPNGTYQVKVMTGSLWNGDRYGYSIEGGDYIAGSSHSGQFAENTRVVNVSDGQLTIAFGDRQFSRTNAIEIDAVPQAPEPNITIDSEEPQVTLEWNADEVADDYQVFRKITTEDSFVLMDTTSGTIFVDTDVDSESQYIYYVIARHKAIESAPSTQFTASFTITPEPTPTQTPAAPSELTIDRVMADNISLRWSSTALEGSVEYIVYRSTSEDGTFEEIGRSTTKDYTDYEVDTSITYYYKVAAENYAGVSTTSNLVLSTSHIPSHSWFFDLGPASGPVAEGYIGVNETTIYTPELGYGTLAPTGSRIHDAPDDLRRDFLLMAGATFVVDVTPGVYHVMVMTGQQYGADNAEFWIEGGPVQGGRTNGGDFAERTQVVEVTDGQLTIEFGGAQFSRTNAIEVERLPDPPEAAVSSIELSASPALSLAWEDRALATSYNVYRKAPNESNFTLIGTTESARFTDEHVELSLTYEYQVTALRGTFESGRSDTVTAVIEDADIAAPASPANVTAIDATATSVSLSWEASSDAILYYVYRSRFAEDRFERIDTTTDISFEDTNVSTHQNMYYQIRAVNGGGLSAPSATIVVEPTFQYVRQMEKLDRGLVAVNTDNGVYIGWRMFGTDPANVWFDLYRDGVKVNAEPIANSTNYFDPDGHTASKYKLYIRQGSGAYETEEVSVWGQQYLSLPLDKPADTVTPDGVEHSYHANDASVGDLDGDGEYEIVLKWEAGGKDNAHWGYTPNVYLDAYKLDGTKLWRIDAGRNIRAGAHYTQFMVYDFDGDGKAEVAFKTADGTVDGIGGVIGDITADHRNGSGYVLDGPEYLTIFNGETGAAIDTIDYTPPRGDVGAWGDGYGNRVDRFLAGVAYLDGEKPSMIFSRGYYTRAVIAAYDFIDGELVQRWGFDSRDGGNGTYEYQGNHNLSIADVDGDGFDEIIFGAAVIDHDGTGLYSTGLGHGDALHVSDFDPERPGLEIYQPHESGGAGFGSRDAETGEEIWRYPVSADVGRGLAADIDPRYLGAEMWSSSSWDGSTGRSSLFTAKGEPIAEAAPQSINHAIWWDGDLLRELLDHDFDGSKGYGIARIDKWDYENNRLVKMYQPEGTRTSNYTKGNPSLQADLLGDWREELIVASEDSTMLQIHTTTVPTEHRIFTLMHDSVYRTAIAWQNVAYNQPPHTSFYLGMGMATPPRPNIRTGDELHPEQGDTQWAIASLTGPTRVYADGAMSLTVRVDQVTNPFRTAEVVIKYDPAKVSFATVTDDEQYISLATEAITPLNDHVQILSTMVKPTEGQMKIILSALGSNAAIASASELFRLNAEVKSGVINGSIITSITQFKVAFEGNQGEVGLTYAQHGATVGAIMTTDKQALAQTIANAGTILNNTVEGAKIGQYGAGAKAVLQRAIHAANSVADDSGVSQLDVDMAVRTLETAIEQFSAKLVTLVEGQSQVSIRDLSILAKYYAITSQDEEWELVAKADLFNDGEINIRVLAAVAKMILSQWSLGE